MLENLIFIIPYFIVFVFAIFIISILLKRNDVADVFWGLGIFYFSYLFSYNNNSFTGGALIALLLVFIWSLRIFTHIGLRFLSKKEEDFRYKIWRESWKYFYVRSFFQVFLLQTVLMVFMASIFTIEKSSQINFFVYLGAAVSIFGFLYESIGDYQLKKFINKKSEGIMKTGLWSTTRHPNYFGEVTFWWGIFIIFFDDFILTNNFIYLLTPLTITFLILKVSGIPMLEKKYEGNMEWREYKEKTPAFFPKFW